MNRYKTAERAIDEAIATRDARAIVRMVFDTDVPSPEQLAWSEKPLTYLGHQSVRGCLATANGRALLRQYLLQLEFGIFP